MKGLFKTKNLKLFGVMAVCVVAISLMFVAMSYADAEKQATDATTNDVEATIDNAESTDEATVAGEDSAVTEEETTTKEVAIEEEVAEEDASSEDVQGQFVDDTEPKNYTLKIDYKGDTQGIIFYRDGILLSDKTIPFNNCTWFNVQKDSEDPYKLEINGTYKIQEESHDFAVSLKAEIQQGFTSTGWAEPSRDISEGTTFTCAISAIENNKPITIKGSVVEGSGEEPESENSNDEDLVPIPYANVKIQGLNNFSVETSSDENGEFNIGNIPISSIPSISDDYTAFYDVFADGYAPYTLGFMGEGNFFLGWDKVENDNTIKLDIQLTPSALKLKNKDSNHSYFLYKFMYVDEYGQPDFYCEWITNVIGFPGMPDPEIKFSLPVSNDGSLVFDFGSIEPESSNGGGAPKMEVTPIGKDGFEFDNWMMDNQQYRAGSSINLPMVSTPKECFVNYKVPGDNPGTETTGGIETLTAQTGDNVAWAVPFLMLCVLGSATVIARRKCFTK